MSRNCRQIIKNNYSLDIQANNYLQLYNELLDNNVQSILKMQKRHDKLKR